MSSLEYIREKISNKIKTINEKRKFMTNCKIMNIPFNSELTYEDEKELEYLRQVECELEAWEVVKPAIKSKLRVIGKYRDKIIEVNHREYNEGTTEYQALKKASEVEEDGK